MNLVNRLQFAELTFKLVFTNPLADLFIQHFSAKRFKE